MKKQTSKSKKINKKQFSVSEKIKYWEEKIAFAEYRIKVLKIKGA